MTEPCPPPCASDVFQDGETICVLDANPVTAEWWTQEVAKRSETRMDWHYAGGRANVLLLGNNADRLRALKVIHEMVGLLHLHDARILSIPDEPDVKLIPLLITEDDIWAFKKVLSMTFATREITEENRVARTRVDDLYHLIKRKYQG